MRKGFIVIIGIIAIALACEAALAYDVLAGGRKAPKGVYGRTCDTLVERS